MAVCQKSKTETAASSATIRFVDSLPLWRALRLKVVSAAGICLNILGSLCFLGVFLDCGSNLCANFVSVSNDRPPPSLIPQQKPAALLFNLLYHHPCYSHFLVPGVRANVLIVARLDYIPECLIAGMAKIRQTRAKDDIIQAWAFNGLWSPGFATTLNLSANFDPVQQILCFYIPSIGDRDELDWYPIAHKLI
jgi:hypothetical protein